MSNPTPPERHSASAPVTLVHAGGPGDPRDMESRVRELTAERDRLRAAVAALRAGEGERLTAAGDASIGTWTYDVASDTLELSRGAWEMHGAAGNGTVDPEWYRRLIHPDDLPAVRLARATATDPRGDGRFQVEYCVRTPAGQRRVEAVGLATFAPGAAGRRATRLLGVMFDVTERARGRERPVLHHDTFVTLVQNSPFGVYVVDSDFRLWLVSAGSRKVFANVRPLIGRDFAEVLRSVWAEPFASEAIARFRHTLKTGEPYHAPDTTEQRRDIADVESYDWKIERITLPNGRFGVVCHFYDLTQRQQFEAALHEAKQRAEQASVAKSQFLAVMSHELRTPLTGVIGFADLLETEVLGPMTAPQQEALARIKASSWHLVSIIDEILTLTRAEAGKEEVRREETDVAELAREVLRIMEPQLDGARLALRLVGADAPARVWTDPGKVRQILINLVGNAVKFTERGSVEIGLDGSEAGWLALHVRDTGPGIAPEDLERIFEVFTQVDSSHTRGVPGTGLGLTICRRLARLLGGDVEVRSVKGEGSVFTLRLPCPELAAP